MPFTQFYKLLNDKDLYVPKIPHKYVFQDSNTQALYEELRFWREKTKKEYEAIDNKYKNTRYDEYENQLLLRQLRELLKKDLEFLQRLCYDRLR